MPTSSISAPAFSLMISFNASSTLSASKESNTIEYGTLITGYSPFVDAVSVPAALLSPNAPGVSALLPHPATSDTSIPAVRSIEINLFFIVLLLYPEENCDLCVGFPSNHFVFVPLS